MPPHRRTAARRLIDSSCAIRAIELRSTPDILKKGGALLVTKVVVAAVIGVVMGHYLGETPIDGGLFGGLSTLAVVAALKSTYWREYRESS